MQNTTPASEFALLARTAQRERDYAIGQAKVELSRILVTAQRMLEGLEAGQAPSHLDSFDTRSLHRALNEASVYETMLNEIKGSAKDLGF